MKERPNEFVEIGFRGRNNIIVFASDRGEAEKRRQNRNMVARNLNGMGYKAGGLRERQGYRFETTIYEGEIKDLLKRFTR